MPTFFISAKTQFANLGDGVITRELIKLARLHGSVSVQTEGVPAHFLEVLELHPGEAVSSKTTYWINLLTRAIVSRLPTRSERVVYLLNPGGFDGECDLRQAIRQYGLLVGYFLLRALGVKLMRVGCSLGPFGPTRTRIERIKSRLCDHFNARDPISIKYLAENGFRSPEYFPDLAFLLEPLTGQRYDRPETTICLSFRSPSLGSDYDTKIDQTIQRVVDSAPPTTRFLIVTQVNYDVARNSQLAHSLGIAERSEFVNVSADYHEAMKAYARSDLVLSNRLHVLLLGIRAGAKPIAVLDRNVNRKVAGILEVLDLGESVWDINDPTPKCYDHAFRVSACKSEVAFNTQAEMARRLFSEWVCSA